jgi:hypothetical protein
VVVTERVVGLERFAPWESIIKSPTGREQWGKRVGGRGKADGIGQEPLEGDALQDLVWKDELLR